MVVALLAKAELGVALSAKGELCYVTYLVALSTKAELEIALST